MQNESNWRSFIKLYPATSTIILVIIVIHILTIAMGNGATDFETARKFGALQSSNKQWTEFPYLLTSTYQHIGGIFHLVTNVIAIIFIAPFIERIFGTVKFVLLFNLCGIFGSLLTLLFTTNVTSSGASAAVFGLLGIYIALMVKQHPLLTKDFSISIIGVIALNILTTFLIPGISITGHIGGLLAGMLLGMWFPVSKTFIQEGFYGSVFKTIITTIVLFAILLIPQNMIKSHNFVDVATQIGLGDYVTGKKSVPLFNLHRDPVIDEVNWMIDQYNGKSVILYNGIVEDYNSGINKTDSTIQLKSMNERIEMLNDNINVINHHSNINETQALQEQLLIMNETLLEAANHAKKTLETNDYLEGNRFLSKMSEVDDTYNKFNEMFEELRVEYGY